MINIDKLETARAEVFWGELTPCDHMLQIYEDDIVFLDTLEGFVAGGLHSGDGVVVIATTPHLEGLNRRLLSRGIDVTAAIADDSFIALDTEVTLPKFIDDGWPNDDKFHDLVLGLLKRAGTGDRRVRAFGELVAVLWARGHNAATVRLEHLWHNLCKEKGFSLFCAYPKIGFTDYALKSLDDICEVHSRVIA